MQGHEVCGEVQPVQRSTVYCEVGFLINDMQQRSHPIFMPVGNIGAVVGARRAQQRRGRSQSASSQAPRASRPEVTLRTEDVQYVEAPKRSQRGDLSSLPPKPLGCCMLM